MRKNEEKINKKTKKQKKQKKKTNCLTNINVLFFSSFIFITNIISAYYKNYYMYSFLFTCLTITSLIVHTNDNIYTNFIDKVSVLSIVTYGSFVLFNKCMNEDSYVIIPAGVFILFLLCIYLYIYGYCNKMYCFHRKKCIASKYHMLLHIISSVGHHFIIFM
uniref:Uncharacterized protein n=1 Tax=viral metagenome TaxID=1070528 RepID=A0A6C0DDH0_9ZZZZ